LAERLLTSRVDAFEEKEAIVTFFFCKHLFAHDFCDVSVVQYAFDTASGHDASKEQNKPCLHLGAPVSVCCEETSGAMTLTSFVPQIENLPERMEICGRG
jgi:hypothetical protein